MGDVVSLKEYRSKTKNKYYKALCDQKQISQKQIDIQQIFEYFENTRIQANAYYDSTLIAIVLEQIVANQLREIQDQNKKINQISYLLSTGKRICQKLEIKSKIEAQFLLYFLINNFVDKVKIIKTDNDNGFFVHIINNRVYICNEDMYWNGEELINGTASFDNSFSLDNTLVEIKKFLDYILKILPESEFIVKESPFWIE